MKGVSVLHVELGERGYDIHVGAGILAKSGELFDLSRKVLIVTDSGVPFEYAESVAACCKEARIFRFPEGEPSKNINTLTQIYATMLDFGLQRKDAVVAVGGGVVGDISGFAAACYMRGIDFYNIPTTLLSQVDSSIGGKTAIDFGGVKNILGAFHQPRGVLIDTEVLSTLDKRQLACGKAEIIKMAISRNAELFEKIEASGISSANLQDVIIASLKIKKEIVELDERESGLRKILNFGHTLGHGIEATTDYLHGECVALGMLPMCNSGIRERLTAVLKREGLPYILKEPLDEAFEFMKRDKKGDGAAVDAIYVEALGEATVRKISLEALCRHIKENLD